MDTHCPSFRIEALNLPPIFWKAFQSGIGATVKFSTAFHPKIDGQVECTIQTLEDMTRSCHRPQR